jgi:hypothetical protein
MRSMKDTNLLKQNDGNTASLAFADICPKLNKQGLDISPLNVCACRAGEDQFQGSLVPPFHR